MSGKRRHALRPPTAPTVVSLYAPPFIRPHTKTILLSEQLAFVQMVRNDILPGRPLIDIGTDVMTQHRSILKRVQVKGQSKGGPRDGFTFSTRRTDKTGRVTYALDELDAFVFVHTAFERFFVVPADEIIASGRYTITFGQKSHQEWEDAWWILKTA